MQDNNYSGEEVFDASQPRPNRGGSAGASRGVFIVIAAVVIVAVGVFGWMYFKKGGSPASPNSPVSKEDQARIQKETKELLAAVSKHMVLPEEEPTIATILDAKKLTAEQAFYAGSSDGDKLVIYPQARKAIIYSPSKDRVVNAGPVFFDNAAPAQQGVKAGAKTAPKTATSSAE